MDITKIISEIGIIGFCMIYFIQQYFQFRTNTINKKNGTGSTTDRRVADEMWRTRQQEQHNEMIGLLQAQTATLISLTDITESTNGKCGRMEQQVNKIEDRTKRTG